MDLKPKTRRGRSVVALCVLGLVTVLIAATWQVVAKGTVSGIMEVMAIAVITIAVLVWLVLEDQRVRSVELNEQGVSALVWVRRPFPLCYALERVFINWREVRQVGARGLAIWIDSARYRVPINTHLFADSQQVLDFVRQHVPGEGGLK